MNTIITEERIRQIIKEELQIKMNNSITEERIRQIIKEELQIKIIKEELLSEEEELKNEIKRSDFEIFNYIKK